MNKFKIWLKKHRKVLVELLLILAVVALILLCFFLDRYFSDDKIDQSIVNTISQIQISIVALTITMISITTSFLNEDIYGVKLKDIFKLRKGINLSLLSVMIIFMIFTLVSVISIISNYLVTSVFVMLLTIAICLWISIQELPLCFKNDKALIRLLKNNKNVNVNGLNNSEVYNTIVVNLISEKKIEKVYELLKLDKDPELIDYFFNLIINKLTSVKNFDDIQNKIEYDIYVNSILDNISLLFNKESVVFDDYHNSNNLAIYMERIFNSIKSNSNLLDKGTIYKFERVLNKLFWFLLVKEENIKQEVSFKTYQHLLYSTLRKCDLWVVRLLKKEYSSWSNTFTDCKLANIIFSEISFVLFYYYQYESQISKDNKASIQSFIKEEEKYSSIEIGLSWIELFENHLNNYTLTYSDLINYMDVDNFEFMILNRCKTGIFTEKSLADWWIKCLFSSSNLYHYNLDFLNTIEKGEDSLSYYLDDLFVSNSEDIKLDKSFFEFKDFFNIDDPQFEHIDLFKNTINKLYDFKNSIKKQREVKCLSKSNVDSDLDKLREFLYIETANYMTSIWRSDKTIDLTNVQARGFNCLGEMFDIESTESICLNRIENCFKDDFQKAFEKEFLKDAMIFDNNMTKEDLEKCLKMKPIFTTAKVMYVLNSREDIEPALKDKLIKLDDELLLKKTPLLGENCYGNDKSLKFNYEIDLFELNSLSNEELLKIIDEYKSEKGTYFYQGIQYSYNELINVLKQKLFTMKIYIKYKIIYDKNNLYIFDPWDIYKRKKK